MKLIIGVFILLLTCSCIRHPKDALTLSVIYKPENTYQFNTEQTLRSTIKYSGNGKILQTLKSRGILNPTIINKKSQSEAIFKTGKLEEDKRFSVTVTYLSATESDNANQHTIQATFHDKCFKDSIPIFDVAIAKDLDQKTKIYLLDSWNKIFSQVSFSYEKLKIGQELIKHNLQSIPMEGSEIEMEVTTNFKLIEIKEGNAYFDISQQFKLSPKLLDNSFDGSGNGKGQMIYDMNNSIVTNYSLDTEMQLTKKLDSFKFQLQTISTVRQTIKLVNNKE